LPPIRFHNELPIDTLVPPQGKCAGRNDVALRARNRWDVVIGGTRIEIASLAAKVKGEDNYLYRALDSTGQTIDFPLTA